MPDGADVFVSYTQVDEAWAVWIAWQLEAAGFSTIVQAWDFATGQNFLREMHEASRGCACTLAVLSPDYVKSRYAMEELWTAHANSRLVPVRVREFMPDGLLRAVIYCDLLGLEAGEASETLLTAVRRGLSDQQRARPEHAPSFPGIDSPRAVPPFPGHVRFRIPHKLAYFTGRHNELASIDRALASGEPSIVTQTIAGLCGCASCPPSRQPRHAHAFSCATPSITTPERGRSRTAPVARRTATAGPYSQVVFSYYRPSLRVNIAQHMFKRPIPPDR